MFIIGFLCGIGFVLLLSVFILIYVNYRQSKSLLKYKENIASVKDEDIEEIIKSKKKLFTQIEKFGFENNLNLLKTNSLDVVKDIAKEYCPDAKYPMYELTLEEILLLNIHISERLLKNLSSKKLEIFKKLKISKILELNDFKNNIKSNPIYSKIEKYKLLNLISKSWMIINLANPKYWIKKIFIDGSLEIGYRTLSIIIINSIGKETHRVYSRKFKEQN